MARIVSTPTEMVIGRSYHIDIPAGTLVSTKHGATGTARASTRFQTVTATAQPDGLLHFWDTMQGTTYHKTVSPEAITDFVEALPI
jgi:WD40 repeat protein